MGISVPTLLAIGAATSAAGAVTGTIGAIQQGDAAAASARYNAAVAQQNAQAATNNAKLTIESGEQQAAVSQQKTRAQVGAIMASQAADNVDVNSGSAVDVRSSAAELGQLDAITLRSNAAKTAYGYQTQATGFEDQSTLDTSQAANDQTAGLLDAGGTLLGGVGNAANNWAKFQNTTGFAGGG